VHLELSKQLTTGVSLSTMIRYVCVPISAKVVLSLTKDKVDLAGSTRPDSSSAASVMDLLELQKLEVHSPGIPTDTRTVYAILLYNLVVHIGNILCSPPMV